MFAVAAMVTAIGAALCPTDGVAAVCWRPPVEAPISDPYRAPACPWCAGNRGIEYATRSGTPVRAVAAGRVSFAGTIAGRTYLVVRHADGLRATYGHLRTARFAVGDLVVAGSIVGTAGATLHFGLRDGDRYLDPAPWIGRLVRPAWLVPTDGSPGGPPAAPKLRCRAGGNSGVPGVIGTWRR